jgi:hypothetical protein
MTVQNGNTPAFDLDAARAARAETVGETFPFIFKGEQFAVQSPNDWPLDAQARISDGDFAGAFAPMLVGGIDTFNELVKLGMTVGDLNALFDEIGKWSGTGSLPNSAAPSPAVTTQT